MSPTPHSQSPSYWITMWIGWRCTLASPWDERTIRGKRDRREGDRRNTYALHDRGSA
ncbi:hypothetical protein BDZ89DRAFT_1058403 [Hymenopellis radicata]|nr:hypothetical protein BDZ89DRAFT_1058403 [Hymenopellis radicata]